MAYCILIVSGHMTYICIYMCIYTYMVCVSLLICFSLVSVTTALIVYCQCGCSLQIKLLLQAKLIGV